MLYTVWCFLDPTTLNIPQNPLNIPQHPSTPSSLPNIFILFFVLFFYFMLSYTIYDQDYALLIILNCSPGYFSIVVVGTYDLLVLDEVVFRQPLKRYPSKNTFVCTKPDNPLIRSQTACHHLETKTQYLLFLSHALCWRCNVWRCLEMLD